MENALFMEIRKFQLIPEIVNDFIIISKNAFEFHIFFLIIIFLSIPLDF